MTGAWLSFAIASMANAMSFIYKVSKINWNKQIAVVEKNMEDQINNLKNLQNSKE